MRISDWSSDVCSSDCYKGDLDEVTRGVTHILLTHGHSDHVGDTVDFAKKTGATLVSSFEVVNWLNGQDVEKIEPMNTGGSVKLDGFTVTLVQAFHSSGDLMNGVYAQLGNPNGFVVRSEENTSDIQSLMRISYAVFCLK